MPECEVRAFGSRATWTAKDYSDLDLAVVGEGPLDWRTLDRLKEAFEESDLPMRVDVLDWHAISDSFREVIERDYVVMQERAKQEHDGRWREVALGEIAEISTGLTQRHQRQMVDLCSLGFPILLTVALIFRRHSICSEDDYLTWTRRVTRMPGDVVFSYETRLGEAAILFHWGCGVASVDVWACYALVQNESPHISCSTHTWVPVFKKRFEQELFKEVQLTGYFSLK